MGRRSRRAELVVRMNGDLVGRLTSEVGGRLRFAYDESWLRSERATALSVSLPLSTAPYTDARVTSYFENLLPDAESTRQRMQATLGAASRRAFDLLAVAGRDCVGAIQLLPDETPVDVRRIDAEPIDDHAIAEILRALPTAPLGMSRGDDFRMSVAGMHAKTGLLRRGATWLRPHGATPTSHLLKPAIGRLGTGLPDLSDSVETEWLSTRITAALGLPVPNVDIARFEDQVVLVVERFDRRWSLDGKWLVRVPQEDLCQALGVSPALKYEADGGPGIRDVMRLLLGAERPDEDRATFFRSVVVSWLLAAIDAHAKNYSVFLLPGHGFRLAPVYDVVSAYPLIARRQMPRTKLKLAMAALGKTRHYRWSEIRGRHWRSTAEACALPKADAEAVLGDLSTRIEPAITRVARALPRDFPASVADPVLEGVRKMRGLLDHG